ELETDDGQVRSYRRPTIGSTLAARRAGNNPASTEAARSSSVAAASVVGSLGESPNNWLRTTRARASAAGTPTPIPTAATSSVSRRIIQSTSPARAPRDIPTP